MSVHVMDVVLASCGSDAGAQHQHIFSNAFDNVIGDHTRLKGHFRVGLHYQLFGLTSDQASAAGGSCSHFKMEICTTCQYEGQKQAGLAGEAMSG